jgi:hypothetical protein
VVISCVCSVSCILGFYCVMIVRCWRTQRLCCLLHGGRILRCWLDVLVVVVWTAYLVSCGWCCIFFVGFQVNCCVYIIADEMPGTVPFFRRLEVCLVKLSV